jgi:hypothetical protein
VGSEASCSVRFGDQVSAGKALLETTELAFRGEFRLKIPFKDMTAVASEDGRLSVSFPAGTAVFELGRDAETWAKKILNPRGLLEKLGVKQDARVGVIGVDDAGFIDQLRARTYYLTIGAPPAGADLVFYEANAQEDLARLPELADVIAKHGAVWVVSPKGKGAVLRDVDVMAAARAAGLVDTKVVAFSESHTALKLVIPRDRR